MPQFKKQLANVVTATVFTILSMLLFRGIALLMLSAYGDYAKAAFIFASSKLFSKTIFLKPLSRGNVRKSEMWPIPHLAHQLLPALAYIKRKPVRM
jgi:hypothetical protein